MLLKRPFSVVVVVVVVVATAARGQSGVRLFQSFLFIYEYVLEFFLRVLLLFNKPRRSSHFLGTD